MSRLTWFCILALVVAMVAPAYAEVQNVKVSGDITTRYIYRSDLDLKDGNDSVIASDGANSDSDQFFMSDIGVNVSADLTDNVSTMIRLANQRDWGNEGTNASDINLSLGYVTLKEMLYAPLTLVVGRQQLWYGKGFIVGSTLLNGTTDPDGSISANEFGEFTAFDAVRAILDYKPWTIDLVYAKINRGADTGSTVNYSDKDLYGVNVGYKWENKYNAEAEAYYFGKEDRTPATVSYTTGVSNVPPTNSVDTFGLRGSMTPLENLNIFGEIAGQWGKFGRSATNRVNRRAMAGDIGADYTFKKLTWEPNVALEYIYYSGDKAAHTGSYKGWDSMYRGKFDSLIREFQTSMYATTDANDVAGTTNENQLVLSGTIKPTTNLTAKLAWDHVWAAKKYVDGRKKGIGEEIDAKLTYDYTKDVQFNLIAGWFIPGNYYDGATTPANDTATEVVGAMKVTF